MIEIGQTPPFDVVVDHGEMCSLVGVPFVAGAPVDVDAQVIAADDAGHMMRWRCRFFGAVGETLPVTQDGGDAMSWRCEVVPRDGQLVLQVAGEPGVVTRWWMSGYVRVYA